MELPSDATIAWLQLLFATMWPGLLSLVVYRARVPGPTLEWKDSFVIAAFFTAINYLLLLPLALFVARGPGATPSVSYWVCALVVLVVGPIAFPLVWSWLRTTRWLGGYASLSPHAGDLYLTHVYHVSADGSLGEKVADTDGAIIPQGEYSYIELLKVPEGSGS